MFDLITKDKKFTMSSYDFLNEVINPARISAGEQPVRNRDFVARIEDELDDLGASETFARFGNTVKYYDLTIEQMTLVGMRESKAVRRRVLEVIKDLSERNQPKIPQSFSEALQLAANQAKMLEEQAPKVQYYDKVVERENLLNASQVGQKLGLSAVRLNKYLEELNVYNKAIKRSRVFQQWFIDKGLGILRQTELGYPQAMFTVKGEAWVIERLVAEGVA